jgi:hypothetical protein
MPKTTDFSFSLLMTFINTFTFSTIKMAKAQKTTLCYQIVRQKR